MAPRRAKRKVKPFQGNLIFVDTEAADDKTYLGKIGWAVYSEKGMPLHAYRATIVAPGWPVWEGESDLPLSDGATIPLREKDVPEAKALQDLAQDIEDNAVQTIVGHHIDWDISVIEEAGRRASVPPRLPSKAICTMYATAQTHGAGRFMKLGALYRTLFNRDLAIPHDPLWDAVACACCFWHLQSGGFFNNYDHAMARARSGFRSHGDYGRDLMRWVRTERRSTAAKSAADSRAAEAAAMFGGAAGRIIKGLIHLDPETLALFFKYYEQLTSPAAARYLLSKLREMGDKLSLQPEPTLNCVKAYCFIAPEEERRALGSQFLARGARQSLYFQLELGDTDPRVEQQAATLGAISQRHFDLLVALCGGHKGLAAELEARHKSGQPNDIGQVAQLVGACSRSEDWACGSRTLTLPYGDVHIEIKPESFLKTITSVLANFLRS